MHLILHKKLSTPAFSVRDCTGTAAVNKGEFLLLFYGISTLSSVSINLSEFFLSLLDGYMEGNTFLSHILYLTTLKFIHPNSTKWMSKTHGSDICGVRGSTRDIRTWSNISWQLWLIKCLTSQFVLQLMQNEHENFANKCERQNLSPGTADQVKPFKLPWLFTTVFILPQSPEPTKTPCAVSTPCGNPREKTSVEEAAYIHTERPQP